MDCRQVLCNVVLLSVSHCECHLVVVLRITGVARRGRHLEQRTCGVSKG
uniref:Uncharacterized protein n=1 Tax=Arundo donax TaxID=35708 RepID=A0A0A9DQS5_ARUDO